MDLDTIMRAKEHGATIIVLPPHTIHFMNPLDTHVFRSLKRKWETHRAAKDRVTTLDFVKNYGRFYTEAFQGVKGSNIVAGLRDDGLIPPQRPLLEARCARALSRFSAQK